MNRKSSYKLVLSTVAIAGLLTLTACGGKKNVTSNKAVTTNVSTNKTSEISPNKIGLDGEFDENGLAKRVAKAIEGIPNLNDVSRVYVAQAGDTIILKGNVSDRNMLDRVIAVARKVKGVGSVNSDGVTVQ